MSKRTLFLIFALFVITAVLLVMALYKPSAPQTTTTVVPTKEPVAQTILSFGELLVATSSSTTVSYSLPINITTGKNRVTAVQLELLYDPQVLSNISVNPGSFFQNPIALLNQIDTQTGRISYAFGISPTSEGVMGKGMAAVLTFNARKGLDEETAILFLPKTLVTAEGITESVLKETNVAQFTVGKNNSLPPPAPTVGPNQ